MNWKAARTLAGVMLGVFVLLGALGAACQSDALKGLGLAALVVMAVVELAFDRCPHCRAYVGRTGGHYCPRCGESLEE